MLRDSAQQFLAERSPVAALRGLRDRHDANGYDPALWREIAELGWPAAVLPEAYGGLGVGYQGLATVFEQLGRTLAATPLLSGVVLGGGLLLDAGSEAQRAAWLPRVATGEALLALALEESPRLLAQRQGRCTHTRQRMLDGRHVGNPAGWRACPRPCSLGSIACVPNVIYPSFPDMTPFSTPSSRTGEAAEPLSPRQ